MCTCIHNDSQIFGVELSAVEPRYVVASLCPSLLHPSGSNGPLSPEAWFQSTMDRGGGTGGFHINLEEGRLV